MDAQTIITSSVVAALISGLVVLISKGIDSRMKYITEERQKWRDDIRDLSAKIYKLMVSIKDYDYESENYIKLQVYRHRLCVSLNPIDGEDNKILGSIDKRDRECFQKRIQHLLKHDWERAKFEAHAHYFHYSVLSLIGISIFACILNILENSLVKWYEIWLWPYGKLVSLAWVLIFVNMIFILLRKKLMETLKQKSGFWQDLLKDIFLVAIRSDCECKKNPVIHVIIKNISCSKIDRANETHEK